MKVPCVQLCTTSLIILGTLAITPACQQEPSKPNPVATQSAAPAPTVPQEYSFPSPSSTPLKDVPRVIDGASSRANQKTKLDEWLKATVKMPVELTRTAKDSLSELSTLSCGYEKDLTCAVQANVAKSAVFFVTSTITCFGDGAKVIKKADWQLPADTKRGAVSTLPVPSEFLRQCWEEGGTKLEVDLYGSKCKVPFTRVVQCAGEYTNCRDACKAVAACQDKCESNRRICLGGCK